MRYVPKYILFSNRFYPSFSARGAVVSPIGFAISAPGGQATFLIYTHVRMHARVRGEKTCARLFIPRNYSINLTTILIWVTKMQEKKDEK